ncbi:CASP8-associated protein 2 isoform X2 [Engraulis encrasicolus]|uniref:CASP8-associated protein 2 isoform X2 n=1 Tax=Engraulis encrasicolus TaxID=184585 RepID=UPI002FD2DE08
MEEFTDASFDQHAHSDSGTETFAYHEEDSVDIYADMEGTPQKNDHSGKTCRSSSSPMPGESLDLFEEIIVEERLKKEATFTEMKTKFEETQNQLQELVQKLQLVETQNGTLQAENTLLKKNLCSLIKTAKNEIGRKDAEINRLSERSGRGSFEQTYRRPQWNQHASHSIPGPSGKRDNFSASISERGNYDVELLAKHTPERTHFTPLSTTELPRAKDSNVGSNLNSSASTSLDSAHGRVPGLHHIPNRGSLNPTATAPCSGYRSENNAEVQEGSVMVPPTPDSVQNMNEKHSSCRSNLRHLNPSASEKSTSSKYKDGSQKHKSPPLCLTSSSSETSKAPSKDFSDDLSERSRVGRETDASTCGQRPQHSNSSERSRDLSRHKRDKSPPLRLSSTDISKEPTKDSSEDLSKRSRVRREMEGSTSGQHDASSEKPKISSHKSKVLTKDHTEDLSKRSRVVREIDGSTHSQHKTSSARPIVLSSHNRDKSAPLCQTSSEISKGSAKDFPEDPSLEVGRETEGSARRQGSHHKTSSERPRVSSSHKRDKGPSPCLTTTSEISKGPTKDHSEGLSDERDGREMEGSTYSRHSANSENPRFLSSHKKDKIPPLCLTSSEISKGASKDFSRDLSEVGREIEGSIHDQGSHLSNIPDGDIVSSKHKRDRNPPLCLTSSSENSEGPAKVFSKDVSEADKETEGPSHNKESHHSSSLERVRGLSRHKKDKNPPLSLTPSETFEGPAGDGSEDLLKKRGVGREMGSSTGDQHNTSSEKPRVSSKHKRDRSHPLSSFQRESEGSTQGHKRNKSPARNDYKEQRKKEQRKECTNTESTHWRADKKRDHELRKSERRKEGSRSNRESTDRSMKQKGIDKAPERRSDRERRSGVSSNVFGSNREDGSSQKKDKQKEYKDGERQTEQTENNPSSKVKLLTTSEKPTCKHVDEQMHIGVIYHSSRETVIECRKAKTTVDTGHVQMKSKPPKNDHDKDDDQEKRQDRPATQGRGIVPFQELAEDARPVDEENSPNRKLSFMETLNLTLSPVKKQNQNQNESTEAGSLEKSHLNDTGEEFFVIDELEASADESHVRDAAVSPVSSSKFQVDLDDCNKTSAVENEISISDGCNKGFPQENKTSVSAGRNKTSPLKSETSVSSGTDLTSSSQADVLKADAEKQNVDCFLPSSEVAEKVTATTGKNTTPVPQEESMHGSKSAYSNKAATLENNIVTSVSTKTHTVSESCVNVAKGNAHTTEPVIHNITETAKENGQRNVLDTTTASLVCAGMFQDRQASEKDFGMSSHKEIAPPTESCVHLDSVSSTVNLTPPSGPCSSAILQGPSISTKEPERPEELESRGLSRELLSEVSKVSSTTRKDSVLQEKVVASSNETPQHIVEGCEPDSTENTEHNSEPSSSTLLPPDEDSMMLTLKTIKFIPDAISPLTSPVRPVKKVQPPSPGKQTHVKSLSIDLQHASLEDNTSTKAVDVNKENKKPECSMPAPEASSTDHNKQEDLEEGEIVSEDETDEAPVTEKSPNTPPQDGKKCKAVKNGHSKTVLMKMHSKRNSKDLEPKVGRNSTRPVTISPPGKRRFKTVPPPDPKALPPSSTTVEEIMNMFKIIRSQLRKKYMKLHKSFPKKTFTSVIEMSNLSFTDLVSSLNLHALCDQESVMKAKLKKIIINVMNKVGDNGIVNRIFEQNSHNLKSKLWAFVEGQLDFLFKEIQTALSGSSPLLDSKPLLESGHTENPDKTVKVQKRRDVSPCEIAAKRPVEETSIVKTKDSKPLLKRAHTENPDKTGEVQKKPDVSPCDTSAKRPTEANLIVKAKNKPLLQRAHTENPDKVTNVKKKQEVSPKDTTAKVEEISTVRTKEGPVVSTPGPPRRPVYPTGLGSRGKNLKMRSLEETDEDASTSSSHEKVPQTSSQDLVTDKSVERVSTLVRQMSHSGSVLDKAEFEILTEQQTSSLTFNLVSDSQMGDIFKSLLQGSDLLENSTSLADNQSWLLATPKKDLSSDRSLLTAMLSPTKFGTPSKLMAAWASISPCKFLSPTPKVPVPLNPAALDESCLLEIPSSPGPSREPPLSTSASLLRTYSILAEDLAVSLTIPSPLKTDSRLSFLHPAIEEPVPTPPEVLSAHFSEDAVLDGEDATEHDIHLSLDTDNSSEASSATGHTWGGSSREPSREAFQIKPHMPMQAVVTERSNDHFIVKIRHASTVNLAVAAPAPEIAQVASLSSSEASSSSSSDIDGSVMPAKIRHASTVNSAVPAPASAPEIVRVALLSSSEASSSSSSAIDGSVMPGVEQTPHETTGDFPMRKSGPERLQTTLSDKNYGCGTMSSKSHVDLPVIPAELSEGRITVTTCTTKDVVGAPSQDNNNGYMKKRKRKSHHIEPGFNTHVDLPVPPYAIPDDVQLRHIEDCGTPGSKVLADLPVPPVTKAEAHQEQFDATTCLSKDEAGALCQDNINGQMKKRKKKRHHVEPKPKRAKTEAVGGKHGKKKRAKKAKRSKKRDVLSTPKKKKAAAPSPQLSPQSLSAKNVVRKRGEVVATWTREEDRNILLELKTKGPSRDTFSDLSEKLKKSPSQIAERFSQLMKLFKKKEKMDGS